MVTPKSPKLNAAILLPSIIFIAAAIGAEQTKPDPVHEEAADQTVVLSPFEVIASDDGSYMATTTLAGTRFNSELKDVPASLSVMTADFLRDINASNIGEALQYTIGAEFDQEATTGNERQSSDMQVRMRGLRRASLGRNFFEVNVGQDSYNMERVTFSRGPNSVIFGTGGAGGIADATTKRAQQRKITSYAMRLASFDDYRFELDINRPASKTFAVRLNALYWSKKGWRDFEHMDRRSTALALTWRPYDRTTIRFDGEFGKVDELRPQPWPMLDSVTNWINAGRPISGTFGAIVPETGANNSNSYYFISNSNKILRLRGSRVTNSPRAGAGLGFTVLKDQSVAPFSQYVAGPGATTNNDFLVAGIFLEQRIARDFYVEFAANRQRNHRDWNRPMVWNQMTARGDPNAFLPDGSPNPFVGQYYVENNTRVAINRQNQTWNDYRVTTSYKFALSRLGEHQIAGLWSRRDYYNRGSVLEEAWANNPSNPDLTASVNSIVRRTYVSFYDSGSHSLPTHFVNPYTTPINVNGIETRLFYRSKTNTLSQYDSVVGVMQSRFWKDRIVTTIGIRRDEQTSWGNFPTLDPITREVLSASRNPEEEKIAGTTRTLGAVAHLLPWLSLVANFSNNATPQDYLAFGLNAEENNTPLGARKGEGMDIGLRLSAFEKRVQGSIAYYETDEKNSQRFKFGNANTGWELWFKQGYLALEKPYLSITGEDTVDIVGHGWEAEWTVNVNRNLRFVLNGTKQYTAASNQWPRITAFAQALIKELRARPDLPITGVTGFDTADALATKMEDQIAVDHRADGKQVQNSRPYSGNIFANYRFTDGLFKGLAVSLGLNVRGKRVIGYNTTSGDPIMDADYVQFNPSVSYNRSLRIGNQRVNWMITLAGSNVFGHRYGLLPITGDEISVDRFAFEVTPTVSLTNRFSF